MVPLPDSMAPTDRGSFDVLLERAAPGVVPAGSYGEGRARHAVLLYEEAVALVLAADHDDLGEIDEATLELVDLLDYPGLPPQWPEPIPWASADLAPASIAQALDLVAAGLGGILLPLPLARHLVDKHSHAVLPVMAPLPGTGIWATWATERDGEEIQQLIGIMRGRTPRSSRGGQPAKARPTPKAVRGSKKPARQAKPRGRGGRRSGRGR